MWFGSSRALRRHPTTFRADLPHSPRDTLSRCLPGNRWPAVLWTLAAGSTPLFAQNLAVSSPDGRRQITALRLVGTITLDGVLDDETWAKATPATGFIQADPREGQPATEATEVRIAFDDDYLYIGARCRDSDPTGHRRQRNPQGLRRARTGHLRGAARHVRRSPQRLRLRDQCGGREGRHADRQRGPRRQHELGRGLVGRGAQRTGRLDRGVSHSVQDAAVPGR